MQNSSLSQRELMDVSYSLLFVFVFFCTSFGFVLPLDITPMFWSLACLDMMRMLWGCQPS